MAMDSRSSCARGRHARWGIVEPPYLEDFGHARVGFLRCERLRAVALFNFRLTQGEEHAVALSGGLISGAVFQHIGRYAVFREDDGFLALRRLSAHVIELRAQISDRSNKRKRCHSGCHKAPTFITIIMVLIIDALIDKSSNTSMRTLACYSARANYPRPSVIRSWRRRCQWRRGSWRRTGASRRRAPHLSARRR